MEHGVKHQFPEGARFFVQSRHFGIEKTHSKGCPDGARRCWHGFALMIATNAALIIAVLTPSSLGGSPARE